MRVVSLCPFCLVFRVCVLNQAGKIGFVGSSLASELVDCEGDGNRGQTDIEAGLGTFVLVAWYSLPPDVSSYAIALVCRSVTFVAMRAVVVGRLPSLGYILGADFARDCAC